MENSRIWLETRLTAKIIYPDVLLSFIQIFDLRQQKKVIDVYIYKNGEREVEIKVSILVFFLNFI